MPPVDYAKLNKIALRNFSQAVDMHDVVKTMLVRMIRRKHPNIQNCLIYTETPEEKFGGPIPDVTVHLKENFRKPWRKIVYEIQEKFTKAWIEKMNKQYEEIDWYPIPLQDIRDRWETRVMKNFQYNKKMDMIKDLEVVLSEYVI